MPQVIAGSAQYPHNEEPPVVTIGNFDGVHLGHRHLLDRMIERARARNAPACVYTFEPPPRVLLAPKKHSPRILPWTDKIRLLGEAGVDQVVVERFTRSFAQHPPEWFVQHVLVQRMRAAELVVGYDFRFGRGRLGDVAMLRSELPTLPVQQVKPLVDKDTIVSSSIIRKLVEEGEIQRANYFLGRPHWICGTVVPGDQRGRELGFPTANVLTDDRLLPRGGVYAVSVQVNESKAWQPAIANLGTRPTFDGSEFLIEVHLIDFDGDLYGSAMRVAFLQHIRDEVCFDDAAGLKKQLHKDLSVAREIFG